MLTFIICTRTPAIIKSKEAVSTSSMIEIMTAEAFQYDSIKDYDHWHTSKDHQEVCHKDLRMCYIDTTCDLDGAGGGGCAGSLGGLL